MTQSGAKQMTPQDLLVNNRDWSRKMAEKDEGFFSRLSEGQSPKYLWIGCSDSRVPANMIVGTSPGDMFVHRNIANVVAKDDLSCLSVLQYAVGVLGVEHIIVTGHYGCGGVMAAMEDKSHGRLDGWLSNIKAVYLEHYDALMEISDLKERVARLCELNVAAQVRNVARTPVVQEAWQGGKSLRIHGWIYALADGTLKDLEVGLQSNDEL